jgi:hypothetical protein
MLVWKAQSTVEPKGFAGRPIKRGVRLDGFYGYLLDGQPRLTALAYLRDGDEEYPLMFYVWPDREAEGNEALYISGRTSCPRSIMSSSLPIFF